MKKTYITPSITMMDLDKETPIICASTGSNTPPHNLRFNADQGQQPQPFLHWQQWLERFQLANCRRRRRLLSPSREHPSPNTSKGWHMPKSICHPFYYVHQQNEHRIPSDPISNGVEANVANTK